MSVTVNGIDLGLTKEELPERVADERALIHSRSTEVAG